MMNGSGIFDFGLAKSLPGDANTWFDKIFHLEDHTKKLNIAAQLHQAANHGTGFPLVFVTKTLIKNSEDFGTKIPEFLQYFAELVSTLSGNELIFQTSPNEFRNFGCADADVHSHVGVLAAHRRLGTKRTAFPRFSGTLSFSVTLNATRHIIQPTTWCFKSTLRPNGQAETSIAH
jgi:hypothetical protein